jgi:adenosylcobinamide-GDP ribazoletransferase
MTQRGNITDAEHSGAETRLEPVWPGWPRATAQAIRFYSRLPVPALPGEDDPHAAPDFRVMPRAVPLAALVIATPAMVVAALGLWLDLPATLVAALVLATLTLVTGAFHEDGLADSFDGLFGGHDKERRLEIMKDSRIGTFGGCALILAFLLRFSCLVIIVEDTSTGAVVMSLAAAAIWSRVLGIHVLAIDPPARAYGALATVGQPSLMTARLALGLGAALCLVLGLAGGIPAGGLILGLALGVFAALGLAAVARRLIGGPTGDIAGAIQQLAEIAVYLGIVISIT